jgi:hypothetical protein
MPHPDLAYGSSKEHGGDWLAIGLTQAARIMLIAACVCYAIASVYTTFHGTRGIMPVPVGSALSVAVQFTMMAASIWFVHERLYWRRFWSLMAYLAAFAISTTFSYVGIRQILNASVQAQRRPLLEREQRRTDRNAIQSAALTLKAALNADFDRQRDARINDAAQSQIGVDAAGADLENQRRHLSAQLAALRGLSAEIDASRLVDVERDIERTRLRIVSAEGRLSRSKTGLAAANKRLEDSRNRVDNLTKFNAASGAAEPTPEAVQTAYEELGRVWTEAPADIRTLVNLPPAPGRTLVVDGRPIAGLDEPIIDAMRALWTKREPTDLLAAGIAALLDGVPFVALFMTRRNDPVPVRVSKLRAWMNETRLQAELTDGILPWSADIVTTFLWRPPVRVVDDNVVAFERFVRHLRHVVEGDLLAITLPSETTAVLDTYLTDIFSRAQVMAFRRHADLRTLVARGRQVCRDIVMNADLAPEVRSELLETLERRLSQFEDGIAVHLQDNSSERSSYVTSETT